MQIERRAWKWNEITNSQLPQPNPVNLHLSVCLASAKGFRESSPQRIVVLESMEHCSISLSSL